MQVKVFTLRFDPRIEGFDDSAMCEFLADKEVLSLRDEFFVREHEPYWGVMATYRVAAAAGQTPVERATSNKKVDYRSLLRNQDWPLFETPQGVAKYRPGCSGRSPRRVGLSRVCHEPDRPFRAR
jgi:hypothetical protein